VDFLPLNALVQSAGGEGDYLRLANTGHYVFARHLVPLERLESDFVLVAQRFVGVPYVWGGKTFAGMDCSGLVQTALAATGVWAPRDTDMMARDLGRAIAIADAGRGDLVFWKGHMGIVLEEDRLLHANGFHMQVAVEPLGAALARIEKAAGPVTAVKRL
jgi:cell wall-associated NlpC family hydrolase